RPDGLRPAGPARRTGVQYGPGDGVADDLAFAGRRLGRRASDGSASRDERGHGLAVRPRGPRDLDHADSSGEDLDVSVSVRVIPCLDVADGRVVKGVKFENLRDAG